MKCWALIPAAYAVAGFLTFATVYEEIKDANVGMTGMDKSDPAAAGPAGLFWPVYWGGRLSLMLIRSTKDKPAKVICMDTEGKQWPPSTDGKCYKQSSSLVDTTKHSLNTTISGNMIISGTSQSYPGVRLNPQCQKVIPCDTDTEGKEK